MTFQITPDKFLTFNGFKIVNLSQPFRSGGVRDIRKRNKSWKCIIRPPNQVMFGYNTCNSFAIRHSRYLFSYLNPVTKGTLRAQAVYVTERRISLHFRCKAIKRLQMANNACTEKVFKILNTIIFQISEQYPFDIIETDFSKNPKIYYLTNIEGIKNPEIVKVLSILLCEYGRVPLDILSREIFEEITYENTDINIEQYRDKSVLFCTLQNIYYAGFLGREIHKVTEQVLPVAMFKNIAPNRF